MPKHDAANVACQCPSVHTIEHDRLCQHYRPQLRFTAISATSIDGAPGIHVLYALASDGTVWVYEDPGRTYAQGWRPLSMNILKESKETS